MTRLRITACFGLIALALLVGCRDKELETAAVATPEAPSGSPLPTSSAEAQKPGALSTLAVDHGELDTEAPDNAPKLAATTIATTVYKLSNTESRRLGYVRLGGIVRRDPEAVSGKGCKGEWYRVYPMGFVCTEQATTDLDSPLVRAASVRPALDRPLPYQYGFVRATAPQYLRVPTKAEQDKSEFKLGEHLDWYRENEREVQKVELGANDVPLDDRGIAVPGLAPKPGFRPSPERSLNELLGGTGPDDATPFWLLEGRSIPNVSGFDVPGYAVFADRVSRKTGLSLVGAFNTNDAGFERRFAITTDLRLIPATKLKPDSGSPFHGIELSEKMPMPFAWVLKRDVFGYRLIQGKDEARQGDPLPRRAIVPLSGNARIKAGKRYYQTLRDKEQWLRAEDLGIVERPPVWPAAAEKGDKWIDISLRQQTLVLYEGKRAWYATLISSGRDRIGDPKTTLSTPRGEFRITSKHIAAAMDSEENSTVAGGQRVRVRPLSAEAQATAKRLQELEARGAKLSEEDRRRLLNVKKGRDPEYGVTERRGSATFELRDVPWIQYFTEGYALHGAYWHDVFGIPRSHGCVNLAPIDARVVFRWTDPPVPEGWHGINVGHDMGEGTAVSIRE